MEVATVEVKVEVEVEVEVEAVVEEARKLEAALRV